MIGECEVREFSSRICLFGTCGCEQNRHYVLLDEEIERLRQEVPAFCRVRTERLINEVKVLRQVSEELGKAQDRAEENEKSAHAENIELRTRIVHMESISSQWKEDLDEAQAEIDRLKLSAYKDVFEHAKAAGLEAAADEIKTLKSEIERLREGYDERRAKLSRLMREDEDGTPRQECFTDLGEKAKKFAAEIEAKRKKEEP